MKLFEPISLGTNLCVGYSLEEALDIVKECGFDYAELSSIVNMCEHIDPKKISPEYIEKVKDMLDKAGIKCYAVAGHVDLTIDEQFNDFLKKIEFAGKIGAKIINTNSGPIERLSTFHKNMVKIIETAERWNVIIGLESHGDIIDTAKDCISIFREYNHPLVRLNYDCGNVHFYSGGTVKIEEDLKYGLEYLSYIHIKDARIQGNKIENVPIGDGDLNFEKIFDVLKGLGRVIPCGLEIPVHMKGVLGESMKPTNVPMAREEIVRAAKRSMDYINKLLN
ncbi:MAG: sugar phosphate isomerase/epimerase family protein [Bacillota bacterium]